MDIEQHDGPTEGMPTGPGTIKTKAVIETCTSCVEWWMMPRTDRSAVLVVLS